MNKNTLIVMVVLTVILSFFLVFTRKKDKIMQEEGISEKIIENENSIKVKKEKERTISSINAPLAGARFRVTKKPFGIRISPSTSPVQPERFSGIHTGTDFEVFPEELNREMDVFAICDGKIIQKSRVSGYGGVIIQECSISGSLIAVIYGHLALSKGNINTGDEVKQGEKIAVLGNNESDDTDGERKHLHLGIHKGSGIDLRGYVNTEKELSQWIDAENYLGIKND